MATMGYDAFLTDPGTVEAQRCRVCDSPCDVTRNAYGPTSWAGAIAQRFRHHDAFVCPHTDTSWHTRALSLVQAIEAMPSKRVAELMRQDLDELLLEHGVGHDQPAREI